MKNSKLAKGIIAGGVGLALLMGGGTFALWNQTQSTNASVQTGHLSFEMEDGQWSVAAADIEGEEPAAGDADYTKIAEINDFHMVPGDTLRYTTTAKIKAVGDTLKAKFTVDWGNSLQQASGGIFNAMKGSGKTTVTVGEDATSVSGMQSASFDVLPLDANEDGVIEVPVTYTLHFPATKKGDGADAIKDPGTWWGNGDGSGQDVKVDFKKVTFSLTQVL